MRGLGHVCKQLIIAFLLCQFLLFPMAFADGTAGKDPLSAALKSTVLPGWGQYENGEDQKGLIIMLDCGMWALLYLSADQRIKNLSPSTPQDEVKLSYFIKDFFGVSLIASYVGGIADAYLSAQEFNGGNRLEKKDPMTALLWSAFFPGLGDMYIGDDFHRGISSVLVSGYLLDKGIAGNNNIEKTWGLGIFAFYYVLGTAFSYAKVAYHNNNIDEMTKKQKTSSNIYPIIDPFSGRMGIKFSYAL